MSVSERPLSRTSYLLAGDVFSRHLTNENRLLFPSGEKPKLPNQLNVKDVLSIYYRRAALLVTYPATLAFRWTGLELITRPLRKPSNPSNR